MLYPNLYTWLLFVSALDVMLTWVVLYYGGREANALADAVIHHLGLPGLVAFKFALVLLVIILCEVVGRKRPRTGQKLAAAGIAITLVPVVIAFALLLVHT
jgi:hypothetical protein